ncbi:uncharacterized protein LOC132195420 [Neocloeon triangulifer]|uniref:uncharacterized protein LOC132195420 n=1 Tax=Neocloeon triangulifer TaxID=2078957 RepID=UPI00286F3D7C|nr:uncharacterized protein LOC132195420 [Neocloeon triangulifer]
MVQSFTNSLINIYIFAMNKIALVAFCVALVTQLEPVRCSGGKDLALDVEVAHSDLLLLSASSSSCFFRTNDIKSLINNEFKTQVGQISGKFSDLGIDQAIIDKFNADMNQTSVSANNLLQLQLNTFQGYEERVHTYEENLLVNLVAIPDNLVSLRKDTGTTLSITVAVDNNLTTYVNFLSAEVVGIIAEQSQPLVGEILDILDNILAQEDAARLKLNNAISVFEGRANTAVVSLEIVANQV